MPGSWYQPAAQATETAPEPIQKSPQSEASGIDFRSPQRALDAGGFAPGAGSPTEQARLLTQQHGTSGDAMNRSVQALMQESLRLRNEEQQGLDYGKELFQQWLPEIQQHPLSERDINELAAGRLEEISRGRMRDMQGLREHLGGAGFEGGMAADLGLAVAGQAMGQATTAMRGLRERASEMTAAHQLKLLSAAGTGQQLMAQQSTYGAEGAALAAGFHGNLEGVRQGAEAAKYAAKKQKEGAIIGGLLGLGGGLLGLA